MTDWQPIETAPRDGTPILGWDGIEQMVISYAPPNGSFRGGWPCLAYDMAGMNPTHWMPLPEPPRSERTGV